MQQLATHLSFSKASGHPRPRAVRATIMLPKPYIVVLLMAIAVASCTMAAAQAAGVYQATNIISDGAVPATIMDPNFIDPWGVSGSNTLWINTNVTGFSYLTSIAGVFGSFKAVVPPASGTGTGSPTGTVQNTTTGFVLSNGTKASFLFATLDGTISGWNSGQSAGGNHALIAINNSSKNAVYTDLALVTNASGTYLLAPNFGLGADVEIYNTNFQSATLAGSFTDPYVPTGYAPYAIKSIGTQVFVTYMLRTTPPFAAGASSYQEVLGTNTGFVSVFDVNGNYISRAVTGGDLNAPWGVAIAPASFGIYGGDLLIGNFGDGLITAYNPTTYVYQGTVADQNGKPIAYPGLWEIFSSTATGANPNAIYFTAGINQETHGLFGVIANSTTASSTPTFNLSASSQVASVLPGVTAMLTVSVAPTNSFTGTVTLSCNGLPAGSAYSFYSNQVSVTPTAPATTTLSLQTSGGTGSYARLISDSNHGMGIASVLLPFGSLLLLGRRRRFAGRRPLAALIALFICAGLIVGCSSSPSGMMPTPAGTSTVTITATSGSLTQTSTVALIVQ